MPAIKTAFEGAFRDFQTADVPSSGAFEPIKGDIRNLGSVIETALTQRLLIFDTIPLLRAEDAAAKFADGECAGISGRVGPGDLRNFVVKWVATSTADHDGFNVFRPTVGAANSGPGRWIRVAANPSQTFPNGNATPSVANGQFFYAGNSTLTNFIGSHEGHAFTVARGATDITIAHDPAKIDCGGVDFKLNSATPRAQFIMVDGVFLLLTPNPDAIVIPSASAAFTTVAAATAATINVVTSQIVTLGYTSAGDGGQARWKRVGSAPSHAAKLTTNGGTVHWELDEETVDIRMLGARSGTGDSRNAIQACIGYAEATGAEIKIPVGKFYVNSGLLVTKPLRIFGLSNGAGPGALDYDHASQISANFASGDVLKIECLQGSTIENVQFISNVGDRSSGAAIHVDGAMVDTGGGVMAKRHNANTVIQHCAFERYYVCIQQTDCNEHMVADNYFQAWGRSAIRNDSSAGVEVGPGDISGNYCFGQTTSTTTQFACLEIHSGYVRAHNNLLIGAQFGAALVIDQISSGNPAFKNNCIEENAVGGIYVINNAAAVVSGEQVAAMLQIQGNEFSNVDNIANFQAHITLVAGDASWITAFQITGNIFKSALANGDLFINVSTGAGGLIADNVAWNHGAGAPIFLNIGAQVSNVEVSSCRTHGTFTKKYVTAAAVTIKDMQGVPVADLPAIVSPGSEIYATDGKRGSLPIQASGSGTRAVFVNSQWECETAAAALVYLDGGDIANANQLDLLFAAWGSGYSGYKIELIGCVPQTDGANPMLRLSTDNGATFASSGYDTLVSAIPDSGPADFFSKNAGAIYMNVADGSNMVGNGAAEGISASIDVVDPRVGTHYTWLRGQANFIDSQATPRTTFASFGGCLKTAQDTDAFRFLFHTGQIASGKWRLYGKR